MRKKLRLSSFQIIIFGFLAVILLGTLLLMLPFSVKGEGHATFLEALFTATSATCVTGLIVRDTATFWSVFGKTVIILLIQVGGMGVVTVAAMISLLLDRRIGLSGRAIMQESISAQNIGGIVRMTRFIIRGVLIIEACGALLLMPVFMKEFGFWKGIPYAFFHSISAFCNAGFDLMGTREAFSSLTLFRSNVLLNLTVIFLILIGGLGFRTWDDVRKYKFRLKRYCLQSKLILSFTLVLVFLPAAGYFFFEFGGHPFGERLLMSLFQAVTPRTAGFNTADLTQMSEGGLVVMILLMLTGGASGSTAGGMKITTVAVLVIAAYSVFRRRRDPQAFGRRIDSDAIYKASAIVMMYVLLSVLSAVVISRVEELPFISCIFETASAVATVGLTLGLTPGLGTLSRVIIVFLMFLGRVGGLTMIFAAFSDSSARSGRYPEEKVSVG